MIDNFIGEIAQWYSNYNIVMQALADPGPHAERGVRTYNGRLGAEPPARFRGRTVDHGAKPPEAKRLSCIITTWGVSQFVLITTQVVLKYVFAEQNNSSDVWTAMAPLAPWIHQFMQAIQAVQIPLRCHLLSVWVDEWSMTIDEWGWTRSVAVSDHPSLPFKVLCTAVWFLSLFIF